MAAFPSTPLPCYPIQEAANAPEVLITTHRDGSEQRRFKGNGRLREWKLSFGTDSPITNTERLSIYNHYEANWTLFAFSWTHPERTSETYTVRYKSEPTWKLAGYNAYEMEVMLQEVPA